MHISPSTSPRQLSAAIDATVRHLRKNSRSRKLFLVALFIITCACCIVLLFSGSIVTRCDPSNFGSEADTAYCKVSSWSSPIVSFFYDRSEGVDGAPLLVRSCDSNSSLCADDRRRDTSIARIVFGIGANADLWHQRSKFVKLWWKPNVTRGFLWVDRQPRPWAEGDLPFKVSEDTSNFGYTHPAHSRSALRMSRIVSESFRLGLPDVDWFVMGDDDTLFFTDNLVRVLSKYDQRKFHYIGMSSEDTIQSERHLHELAFGGGGFAISYPLAEALAGIQDECLERFAWLYGSDERVKACLSELGVPLTKELGFHQLDVHGDVSGLLAAHPVTPIVSLHHLEEIDPIFYGTSHMEGLQKVMKAAKVDSGNLFQQSICYDKTKRFSFSISWGYVVEIYEGYFSPRELQIPATTFFSWAGRKDYNAFTMDTRPVPNVCQRPTRFFMSSVGTKKKRGRKLGTTVYQKLDEIQDQGCDARSKPMDTVKTVRVDIDPLPDDWVEGPRRQCCKVTGMDSSSIGFQVGACRDLDNLSKSQLLATIREPSRRL